MNEYTEGHVAHNVVEATDQISQKLATIARTILMVTFGIAPIFFIPLIAAPFEYSKFMFVVAGIILSLIFFSLSILRSGKVALRLPLPVVALWGVVAVALVSAFLSGDIRDALVGNVMGIHTTAFLAVLALTVTAWSMLAFPKASMVRFYLMLSVVAALVFIFQILRLVFGADFLPLGIFTGNATSPVGSWNDLGLFSGLMVLLCLTALALLPLRRNAILLLTFVLCAALIMLAVINFFAVWIVLGFASLSIIVYSLGSHRFTAGVQEQVQSSSPVVMAKLIFPVIVFIVSVLFVVGGGALGQMISGITGVNYVEVRPSFEATADIAKNVYREDALVGIGTNRFGDAWRLHKNPAINSTIFWNTTFQSGNGYIPTFFVTNGILGVVAWVLFLGLFLISGFKMLVRGTLNDTIWSFIGVSSFVGALYVWGMSLIYVPGVTILLLGAVFTGSMFIAQRALRGQQVHAYNVGADRRTAFLLTLGVVIVIVGSVSVLYASGRHYASVYLFATSDVMARSGESLDNVEARIARAFELSQSDVYARRIAEYQLARINALIGVAQTTNLTEEQQQLFQTAALNGVEAADRATQLDGTDPENSAVLGALYSVLVAAQVEGAYDRAQAPLQKAREYDPTNPLRRLQLAQLEVRANNLDAARSLIQEAVSLKANYTDALVFLSQLDIASGDVEAAIRSTLAAISIEPNNAPRYYQLGLLESARENVDGAVLAFERAVQLDQNYANARYFLALGYNEQGRANDAKAQLEKVLELNPGNELVMGLIGQLEANGTLNVPGGPAGEGIEQASGEEGVETSLDDVTTDDVPDTNLISPVNTPPSKEETSEEPPAASGSNQ